MAPNTSEAPPADASAGVGQKMDLVDAPESDPARDLLGRVEFAQRVAAAIMERNDRESVVVGLYGPWGDGKTTLLGFVASELRSNEQVRLVQFNPWFYSDEAQIFEDFLQLVANALGVSLRTKRERLGGVVRTKVAPPAQGMSVATGGVNVAGSLIGAAGGLLGNPTLRKLRDRLQEVLSDESASGAATRVVVLMDDIDRLDVDQIASVFRMIKLAANFPRISFLLAFDQKVVSEALSGRYGGADSRTGTAFLEKIVQVPLSVPKADPSRVATVLNGWLADLMVVHCAQLSFDEAARLQRAMTLYVWPQITTLRSGKRLLSTAQFVIPLMRGEVNAVDQILLESLKFLYPDLYVLAAHSKTRILRSFSGNEDKVDFQQQISAALEKVSESSRLGGRQLFQELFPHVESIYTNRWHDEREVVDWRRMKRVCSPSHFDRYFGYGLPVGDILDADVDSVFTAVLDEAASRLGDLLVNNDTSVVIQKLLEQADGRSADCSAAVAEVVIDAIEVLGAAPHSYRQGGSVVGAAQLITLLLHNIPFDKREAAAAGWLAKAGPWFAALCMLWFTVPMASSQGAPSLTGEELKRLGGAQARRFAGLEPGEVFTTAQLEAGFNILSVCDTYGARNEVDQLLAAALMADKDLLLALLGSFLLVGANLPLLNPLLGDGYVRLTATVPAESIRAAIDLHFPNARGRVQTIIDAAPGDPQTLQLASDPDFQPVQFLALDQKARSIPPPTPTTVFDPGISATGFNNQSPRSVSQYPAEQSYLVIRAAVIRPRVAIKMTYAGGERASTSNDQARQTVLTQLVYRSGLTRALAELCSACGLGTLPVEWSYQSEGRRETSEFRLETSSWSENVGGALKADMRIDLGWAEQGPSQPTITAVMGLLDIALRMPTGGRRISLAELRDFLVAAASLFEVTKEAGRQLLPTRSYSDGEGAVWVVTNQPGFEYLLDLTAFEKTSRNQGAIEVWLNTTLPLEQPAAGMTVGAGQDPRRATTALAVEAIRRLLLETNLRGYEPTLHDLLQDQVVYMRAGSGDPVSGTQTASGS